MTSTTTSNLTSTDNYWNNKRVFVTGATGLVGSWLVERLYAAGADVIILVRDQNPLGKLYHSSTFQNITVVHGDLSDIARLSRILAEYDISTVFHLAAQTLVGVALKDPIGTLESNVRGTWNLLEAARLTTQPVVITASSDKAYGESADLPYVESHPLKGKYPYDVSKSCSDLISTMYASTYDLRVGITRCGNLFGGGDLNFSRIIPGCIKSTWNNQRFRIRSDGKFVRDYIYVEDAINGYLQFARQLETNKKLQGEALNFSLDKKLNVLDLTHKITSLMGRPDLKPIIENQVSGEIRQQYLNSDRARKLLNWQPHYALDNGLTKTIKWYEDHFNKIDSIKTVNESTLNNSTSDLERYDISNTPAA